MSYKHEEPLKRVEAVLKDGNFELYEYLSLDSAPARLIGNDGGKVAYSTWLHPAMGLMDNLTFFGLSKVQASEVMRALAVGDDTRISFDILS